MSVRKIVLAGSAVLSLGAIGVWLATGREGYTRWPDARLEQADAPPPAGEADLLASAGLTEKSASAPTIRSRFALGLLPGGLDPKHLVSVAAVLGASTGAAAITLIVARKRTPAADTPNQSGAPR